MTYLCKEEMISRGFISLSSLLPCPLGLKCYYTGLRNGRRPNLI